MENKLFFNEPLIKKIRHIPIHKSNYYSLDDVMMVFGYESREQVIQMCSEPFLPLDGIIYINLHDFFRLVLNAPHPDLVRFTNNLFDTILPNLSIERSQIDEDAIISMCGANMHEYFISSGRVDELIADGGVNIKDERYNFIKAHPSPDSNSTRTSRRFEANLIKMLSVLGYNTEEKFVKGVRFLAIERF